MQMVPHQVMGYDRAITVFSPDGRLLQVEYAKKAVSQGATALGIVCEDGVVLMADKRIVDSLIVEKSVRKIFKVDNHIIATASGLISDARVLVKKCRLKAQQHKMTYGEEVDAEQIVRYVSDINQAYTQYGGIRPFGISFLMAGVHGDNMKLYATEPSGIYFGYKAKAIGIFAPDANKMLLEKYREGLSTDEGIKLARTIFKKVLGKEYHADRIETSVVKKSGVTTINNR